jgi:PAT family beta-lactamase induction signal transducer AmpG
MFTAGGLAISLAGLWSWPAVFVFLALLYLPLMAVTRFAPRSDQDHLGAPRSLRAAVWEPFVGFLVTRRSIEILAFVVLYKLADNLAGALVRPFLVQVGFNDFDVGIATATIGLVATLGGTFLGGALTTAFGLGHALWIFGVLQILSNFGYVLIAQLGVNRPLMYGAMGFESVTTGMGTGAFSVLLLRMTEKRFSATQYALFSSLFALPRLLAGPLTGMMVDAVGWSDFFLFTIVAGLPGLAMLQRFSPLGAREPRLREGKSLQAARPLGRSAILARALAGGVGGFLFGAVSAAGLEGMRSLHRNPQEGFDLLTPLLRILAPHDFSSSIALGAVVLFGLVVALFTAAATAARSGRLG